LSVLWVAAGCRTLTQPTTASFASVIIQNHSPEEIVKATAEVFFADGYVGGMTGHGEMTFEKLASRATSFAREGILPTMNGAQVMSRVRVEIVEQNDGAYRIQCRAFKVTGGGDPFFQEEEPIANMRSGPYQVLLSKVKSQLK
jgi:hypothetical protein